MKTSDLFIAALIVLGAAGATAKIFFAAPKQAALVSVETPPASGAIAFDSFGPAHTFRENHWAVGGRAHADWFVSALSGHLSKIELAIEPPAQKAGDATVILADDHNGFPGATVESFVVTPQMVGVASNAAPVVLDSVAQPVLEAGVKYWLCVRGRGGWIWHYNNQNLVQNSARELRRGRWASAGIGCYVCAFRIIVAPHQEPEPPVN